MMSIRARMRTPLLSLLLGLTVALAQANNEGSVYVVKMRDQVDKSSWMLLQRGFQEAQQAQAQLIILSLNTYGGQLDFADSMRTTILNSRIPVWAFVDNQAASAGALIALACDSIYMRPGASMGAATVVTMDGSAAPDKYQSFMRSMMRSTAQAKGKKHIVRPDGSRQEVYRRDPKLAESMVDPNIAIPGIIDSGHILTLTSEEAVRVGMCEGIHDNVAKILASYSMQECKVKIFAPTGIDRFKSFMLSPIVSGILIMLIVGGLYFELQTPGVGFPLVIAILAAVAFFVPLFIEGLVQHIDIILFLVGIALIVIEIFAIPGFGITGILGIICVVGGLALSLINNQQITNWQPGSLQDVLAALATVIVALTLGLIASIVLGGMLISSPRVPALALHKNLTPQEGYLGVSLHDSALVGKTGRCETVLRPSGRVRIGQVSYDAISSRGMLPAGTSVIVQKVETNQIYVVPADDSTIPPNGNA